MPLALVKGSVQQPCEERTPEGGREDAQEPREEVRLRRWEPESRSKSW